MDVRICDDVLAIVQDNKRVSDDWAVERNRYRCEQNAENSIQLRAGENCQGSLRCFGVQLPAASSTCFRENLGASHFDIRIVHS